MNRGKLVIAIMIGLAVIAATLAWWHRWRRSAEVLEAWGSQAAACVRLAPRVEFWQLEQLEATPSAAARRQNATAFTFQGQEYVVAQRWDISRAPGLIHVRHALLQPESLAWDSPDGEPTWEFALHFARGDVGTTVALDFASGQLLLPERGRIGSMARIAQGLATFVGPQLAAANQRP